MTLEEFARSFLKCSFHICIRSSWLAAFSFALEVLFLLLVSFTVCYAIKDRLSFIEFLRIGICCVSFWFKDTVFILFRFSWHLVFSMEIYVWLLIWLLCILLHTKFSYSSVGVSNLFHWVTIYSLLIFQLVSEDQSWLWLFLFYFSVDSGVTLLWQFYDRKIRLQKMTTLQTTAIIPCYNK